MASERFIVLSKEENPSFYEAVRDLLASAHVSPHVVQRYNKAESVLLSVAAGLGVSIMPKQLAQSMTLKGLRLEDLPDPPMGNYVVSWRQESSNPAADLFLGVVHQALQRNVQAQDFHCVARPCKSARNFFGIRIPFFAPICYNRGY